MREQTRWTKVWDAPTRLFHWTLAALIVAAYVTAENGWIDWHFRCGYTILALLLFRLAWGIVGSDTSRFGRFVKSPVAALRHLAHFPRREADTEIGHNAAGGLMVLVMLAVLCIQVGTGLFANDGVFTEGPLARFVSGDRSEQITGWHVFNFNLILGLIVLHVLAILAYAVVKRHDLVRPMVTGRKRLPASMPAPRMASALRAAAIFAVAAGAVYAFITFI
ncbi:cytochrome b/b6 domain-containing protein [Aquabacter spiritensis]|uniref:Cytochrome b n=1 Tax=Aquabacter spiritensis TaxID=933073 RepID=A0A4R3LVW4_9HYPH|nr:cytochrome b/b6 domain-containing protein [Aquabacter spiritensis]TCT04703.1 cytochrome b [Aquabacter spiritensis]